MIKLFRNIRKKLLSEGKTTNYLKYAIGEIVLVVIGILIALQINNWNEQRKQHSRETKIMSEIKSNLEANIFNLKLDIKKQVRGAWCIDYITDLMDNKREYNDSLPRYLNEGETSPDVVLTSAAFETLKSSGLELIENDSLRMKLTNLYEVIYPTLMQETKRIEDQLWPAVVTPLMQKYFRFDFEMNGYIPTDYGAWLNDQEFLNMWTFRGAMRKWSTVQKRIALEKTNKVLLLIENELAKRNNI
ncbi:DUF6090 family protein [Yeosuana sp.]|uniref:DUF6090 family protein n=1 Tax=Yeosuana sp. TaxID=2529388 RepID=UPI004054AFC0|tara:strand:+ start:3954 stop:4688 length:735 start_codon:yes stop_codon:yes gene_type:complete